MAMYKYLVLTDLDGTLLNSHGQLDRRVIDYVHELNNRDDILFCFSTGRSWDDSRDIYQRLNLRGLVSCCNGGHLIDPNTNLNVYFFLNSEIWISILESDEYFKNLKKINILTDKGHFYLHPNEDRKALLAKLLELKANVFDIKSHFFLDADKDSDEIYNKVRFLKSFTQQPKVTVYPYHDESIVNIEIQASYVSKERAMEYIGNYYGVPASNILTFGDQVNDLSVAQGISRFTAVKNSVSIVKQYAQRISLYTNDDCSVIEEIKIFLSQRDGLA